MTAMFRVRPWPCGKWRQSPLSVIWLRLAVFQFRASFRLRIFIFEPAFTCQIYFQNDYNSSSDHLRQIKVAKLPPREMKLLNNQSHIQNYSFVVTLFLFLLHFHPLTDVYYASHELQSISISGLSCFVSQFRIFQSTSISSLVRFAIQARIRRCRAVAGFTINFNLVCLAAAAAANFIVQTIGPTQCAEPNKLRRRTTCKLEDIFSMYTMITLNSPTSV